MFWNVAHEEHKYYSRRLLVISNPVSQPQLFCTRERPVSTLGSPHGAVAFIQMSDVDAGVAFYLSQLCSKDEEVPMRFD